MTLTEAITALRNVTNPGLRDAIETVCRAAMPRTRAESHDIRTWIGEFAPDALFADGFDDAIVGMAERCGQPTLVVYDIERCILVLMTRDRMPFEDAEEYFTLNTLGAWVGEHTPLFLHRMDATR